MPIHKSEDYKLSVVEYYLTEDKTQEEVCKIFKCSARSLLRWVDKYNKNKLIILDNASSHRNEKIKKLLNKHNTLLYSVPYQHFTNSIENYFSMMKSRLQKLDGLTYKELKTNIEKYENIIKEI